MSELEGWEARPEYMLWYDNGNGDAGIAEFDSLEDVESFKQSNQIIKEERYLGNLE